MSNRSMLEINHDYWPSTAEDRERFILYLVAYLKSGDPRVLPGGVTWFGMRHHSEPCPLGEPPRGWDNDREPSGAVPVPAESNLQNMQSAPATGEAQS